LQELFYSNDDDHDGDERYDDDHDGDECYDDVTSL